jgi:transcriptional regulator with PAS, ATPase and Fis domain
VIPFNPISYADRNFVEELRSHSDKSQITWLLAARLCVLYTVLFAWLSAQISNPQYDKVYTTYIIYPLGTLFAFSATSAILLRFGAIRTWFIALQGLVDVIIVTWIVYLSGGPASPFLFLYLPVVMVVSILLSRAYALWAAVISIVLYALLIWISVKGFIRQIDGTTIVTSPPSGFALQIIGLLSAMVLVAVATSYLVLTIRSSRVLVARSQQEFRELSLRQRVLIDGIPEGVITTLPNFSVTSINQKAEALLGLREDQVVARDILTILSQISEDLDYEELKYQGTSTPREIELCGETKRLVSFYGRELHGDEEVFSGYIFIFQDITILRSVEGQLATQDKMAQLLSSETLLLEAAPHIPDFVGESKTMQKVFNLIEKVAPSDATVLLSGESGTGKELAARAIHSRSERRSRTFVAVNCGAIPEHLIESQLFGHKKGSFTGASADHEGFFREADGGTIFLDEIGELPLHLQTKLLRVLQERVVRPVGAERDFSIDVRIIAATNRNLKREVEQNRFREDLFYRLNVINISLPPLRERKDDIPLLVSSFIRKMVDSEVIPTVPPATMKLLMDYSYPGNVRELENILERALVLGGDVLLPDHLPDSMKQSQEKEIETDIIINSHGDLRLPVDLDDILSDIERRYILQALDKTNGVRRRAAEMLGINFRSFRYRLQKFGLHNEH